MMQEIIEKMQNSPDPEGDGDEEEQKDNKE